ncbi:hypothetical protein F4561_005012 [Lipingzhangella halophila]|uniref:DUF8083 domain-containing protein n=1 Tax=Lipingzhangella halophila TaxID=1783352 RepID=A0A7W7RLW6_9ACTN|nr:hypothetical protein [Lipingzhangella halophila]MBB4934192.1 hypothetical protein [Lipingzhangella halophila]
MLPYTAYLRVYQPITAFSSRDRAYWSAYADSPDRPRKVRAVAVEHEESLRRLVATPPIVAPERESGHAYIRRVGSQLYVCPWQTRLRSWLGFRDFRSQTPAGLSTAFVPESAAKATEHAFQRWRERGEPLRTQILTSTWTVPLPWFALFDAQERCLVLQSGTNPAAARGENAAPAPGPPSQGAGDGSPSGTAPHRALIYVTELKQARERLDRAIGVLREHFGESSTLSSTEQLEDWLTGVHPSSLLELDYGGLVRLLDDDELREDESAAEIAAAITGLEKGQDELTVAMYQRVTQRWKAIQALEHAN